MSYSSDSAADRLAAVRAAIERCLTSQEYETADGRRQQMAQLKHLRDMEISLQNEVAQASAGGGPFLGLFEIR